MKKHHHRIRICPLKDNLKTIDIVHNSSYSGISYATLTFEMPLTSKNKRMLEGYCNHAKRRASINVKTK